jgi:hypothetical protein
VVFQLRVGKREHRRGKEHGFIVGMGDKEADGFTSKAGKRRAGDVCRIEPARCEDNWNSKVEIDIHLALCSGNKYRLSSVGAAICV